MHKSDTNNLEETYKFKKNNLEEIQKIDAVNVITAPETVKKVTVTLTATLFARVAATLTANQKRL